ncbi:hypothetical protein ACIGEZ_13740 [Streptomyces sp. NPDC085481]|uniref:hypothetical protein n=1 Tax=Streptomyces sp. NPDC085481 TaxID=3365727 RepID=UPI0037CDF325
MNLTTTPRALVAALAVAGAALGFASAAEAAPTVETSATTLAHAADQEPVELNEDGHPDLGED